jgi:hypothetical protein
VTNPNTDSPQLHQEGHSSVDYKAMQTAYGPQTEKDTEVEKPPSIREIIDPNKTLPMVELRPVHKMESEGLVRTDMAIRTGNEVIGHCTLQEYQGSVHFDEVEIQQEMNGEPMRGKGYGLATYLGAIEFAHERGLPFETQDWNQTEDAVKIWNTLKTAGVAEEIEPFKPDTTSSQPGRYVGKYRVPLPTEA